MKKTNAIRATSSVYLRSSVARYGSSDDYLQPKTLKMIVYYRIITIWCKWPWKDVVDKRYCEFSTSKRKFDKNKIKFTCESNSDLETKRKAIEEYLGKKVKTLIKLK